MRNIFRALSIRQPFAELIIRGEKTIEYRRSPTNIRERVYIYASKTPADLEDWKKFGYIPGELRTGVLIGSIEITDCICGRDNYKWILERPIRAKRLQKPKNKPQQVWFRPFGKISKEK